MSGQIAFVGDIHGNLRALQGLCDLLTMAGWPHAVFLGDYINKGKQSAEVMEELLKLCESGRATLLKGNHEDALLDALDTEDLAAFLKMGGAMSIRSYVGGKVGPEVLSHFRSAVPPRHLDAIRLMPKTYESAEVIAQHIPPAASTPKFRVSAHVPIGQRPKIGPRSAQLDTGCGRKSGRLTALLWPSLAYLQVDATGAAVSEHL
ncbi:metallophosphoesterase [Kribbella sp. C-35]|uniref:metallophosphoesterase n=1 Tax=Kribbella sp. C-35 TaxID=2789276 RepID=UPI00397A20D7